MALVDLYKDDLTFLADARTVKVRAKRYAGDQTDTVTAGRRLELSALRQFFGGINLRVNNIGYMIPHDELSKVKTLEQGDEIIDGDDTFTIESAQRVHFHHQWICVCHLNVEESV